MNCRWGLSNSMNIDALVKEAEALSLPCFDLVPAQKGDRIVAHWGGRRSDLPEKFPESVKAWKSRKHLLSVDEELFKQLGLQGRGQFALVIYTNAANHEKPTAIHTSNPSFSAVVFEDSIPLAAKPATSP